MKCVHRGCQRSESVDTITGNRLVDKNPTALMVNAEERACLQAVSPTHDEIQQRMAAYARDDGSPIIGAEAGGLLRSIARATDARRVFEFGSGFGYSAYWFLRGMPDDGEIILTERDVNELAMAEKFFESAGLHDRASFEYGDVTDAITRYEGPFDVVLLNHQKASYPDAFAAIRGKLPVGGIVIANNIMRPPIAEYVEAIRSDGDFHTSLLPIGNGLALSTREQA